MLGVLESTRPVVEAARHVAIDRAAVERMAERLDGQGARAPEWRVWPHWWDDSPKAADYVLVLDALNFSFWGEPRWRVHYGGNVLDGYWALAACLRRALEAGIPILDYSYLASFDESAARDLFAGEAEIPLLPERIANLREVGQGLLAADGSFAAIVARARGSGEAVVAEVVRRFPSFDDTATYDGQPVNLYKRAQILVSDLHGIYGGQGLGGFTDLDRLTAFADYKIPQVLREAGILVYAPELANTVDRQARIPPGDPREVEIRAATIWACELLRQSLQRRRDQHADALDPGAAGLLVSPRSAAPLRAFEVDWLLWSDAQGRTISKPYHRTRTIYY